MSRPGGGGTLAVPLLMAALLGLAAALWTWTRPGDPALYPGPADKPGVEIHILDNGFHTDLVLPRAALLSRPGPLAEAVRTLPPGDWVLVGWGDARFYVDRSPVQSRIPDGLRAFFGRDNPSVVMLDPEMTDPRRRFAPAGRRSLRLSAAGFAALDTRIEAALALSGGRARLAVARPGDDARFFAGRESFWVGHLCNHWTAAVLNAAGLPVRPARSLTSAEVMATASRAAKLDRTARQD